MLSLTSILALIAQAQALITDATTAYSAIKSTLSSQDQATVSAAVVSTGVALDAATAALDADAK